MLSGQALLWTTLWTPKQNTNTICQVCEPVSLCGGMAQNICLYFCDHDLWKYSALPCAQNGWTKTICWKINLSDAHTVQYIEQSVLFFGLSFIGVVFYIPFYSYYDSLSYHSVQLLNFAPEIFFVMSLRSDVKTIPVFFFLCIFGWQ